MHSVMYGVLVSVSAVLCPRCLLQYVQHCRCVEEACEGWARELLARAVLRAWVRGTAEARREGWEREKRAKMHHTR